MFAALHPTRSRHRVRRLTAALIGALLMLVSGVEPLFADSCDGDAPAYVVAAIADHVDVPITDASAATGNNETSRVPSEGPVEHTVHLCHCTHAHGGLDQANYAVTATLIAVPSNAMPVPADAPASVVGEPPMRPPAALLVM